MRIAIKTFGCKANSTDSDALFLEAKKRGFEVVDETSPADAYVINTCTVTENADRDARHQAHRFKRQNQGALVAMVGCYAQVAKDTLLTLPEVDFVVGTANKFKVLDHFEKAFRNEAVEKDQVEPAKGFLPETFPGSRHARATIKIQDGCNYRCSFCIIPEARGRSRSLSLEIIERQVQEAYREGFREVVLTGIHLAHYGWDQNTDLVELMTRLLSQEGPRIRLSSLDPFEIPEALLTLFAKHERFCPHFHIALQSGSDSILSRMRRIYQAKEFVAITHRIKALRENTFIGVDVIVGFPGEGEQEFQETLDCLNSSYWTKLHVFSFSARKGTGAATLDNQVPDKTISERSEVLRLLSAAHYVKFLESQIGKTKRVILERPSKKSANVWLGHTENYLPTYTLISSAQPKMEISCAVLKVDGDRVWTTLQ
ncbi:MAG: tRNA (N(6)-L-threonylcarbamoyladenosine(37)-C(2))-methylthiotransferase MtaB [Bdellovibrionales bacterium]|nr:tRNA (N(6)-L-threonylcarbamoyladenosine(37)-C(2))-methylthiotransferase MtaB [Bdellovibrionales bacterium]